MQQAIISSLVIFLCISSVSAKYCIKKTYSNNECTGHVIQIQSKIEEHCSRGEDGKLYKLFATGENVQIQVCEYGCTNCKAEVDFPLDTCMKTSETTSFKYIVEESTTSESFLKSFVPSELLASHQRLIQSVLHASSSSISSNPCPEWAVVFGTLGSSIGLFLANAGAALGIAISFAGYVSLGNKGRAMLIKGLVPAIMASVRGVYGLIISILIAVQVNSTDYSLMKAFAHLFSGLAVGISGLASGYCMGVVGQAGMIAVSRQPRLYIGILLILIFAEAIGLYGLIIGLILLSAPGQSCKV